MSITNNKKILEIDIIFKILIINKSKIVNSVLNLIKR